MIICDNDIINKVFSQNCGDTLLILEKTDKFSGYKPLYKCRFIKYYCEIFARKDHILEGKVANYLIPSVYDKGYMGIGKYNCKNYLQLYNIWLCILRRCYDINFKYYSLYGAKGVEVCEEWLNFQNFAAWYEENSSWNTNNYKLELDKDILANIQYLEYKIYPPSTCLLIPANLNGFLAGDNWKSGVYKRNGKFRSLIRNDKKQVHLGTFDTFEEAKQVYAKKKQEFWKKEVNKFNLPSELKDIFLKYKFNCKYC